MMRKRFWQSSSIRSAPRDELREMILLTLARAEENHQSVTLAPLSHELNANVALDLQSLVDQSLVRAVPSDGLGLTEAGRAKANALLRRHRLTERLFTDVLHLDWARCTKREPFGCLTRRSLPWSKDGWGCLPLQG